MAKDKKEKLAQEIVDIVIAHVEATGDEEFDVNFYQATEDVKNKIIAGAKSNLEA